MYYKIWIYFPFFPDFSLALAESETNRSKENDIQWDNSGHLLFTNLSDFFKLQLQEV